MERREEGKKVMHSLFNNLILKGEEMKGGRRKGEGEKEMRGGRDRRRGKERREVESRERSSRPHYENCRHNLVCMNVRIQGDVGGMCGCVGR